MTSPFGFFRHHHWPTKNGKPRVRPLWPTLLEAENEVDPLPGPLCLLTHNGPRGVETRIFFLRAQNEGSDWYDPRPSKYCRYLWLVCVCFWLLYFPFDLFIWTDISITSPIAKAQACCSLANSFCPWKKHPRNEWGEFIGFHSRSGQQTLLSNVVDIIYVYKLKNIIYPLVELLVQIYCNLKFYIFWITQLPWQTWG